MEFRDRLRRAMTETFPTEDWLMESGALKRGHFLLSSGLHSPAYVQCALLLQDPSRARRLGRALAAKVAGTGPDSVLSPALGGLIIGHEVAEALAVPFRFVERVNKAMSLRRGFTLARGERVVIVEDVITTGKSTLEAVEVARGLGAEICGVASILDRTSGRHVFEDPFFSLHELVLPTYEPGECPLCQSGDVAYKPGSRPSP
jgi:orotate phosphoribosyltransferase